MKITPSILFLVCCSVLILCSILTFTGLTHAIMIPVVVTAGVSAFGALAWHQYERDGCL